MESRWNPERLVLSFVTVLILVIILVGSMTNVPTGTSPFSKGKKKLPGPARDTDDGALFRCEPDALLDTREDIEISFAWGGLKGCDNNTAKTCERRRQYACRNESVFSLPRADRRHDAGAIPTYRRRIRCWRSWVFSFSSSSFLPATSAS